MFEDWWMALHCNKFVSWTHLRPVTTKTHPPRINIYRIKSTLICHIRLWCPAFHVIVEKSPCIRLCSHCRSWNRNQNFMQLPLQSDFEFHIYSESVNEHRFRICSLQKLELEIGKSNRDSSKPNQAAGIDALFRSGHCKWKQQLLYKFGIDSPAKITVQ